MMRNLANRRRILLLKLHRAGGQVNRRSRDFLSVLMDRVPFDAVPRTIHSRVAN